MLTYNGNIVTYGGNWVGHSPYIPPILPNYTIRFTFGDSGYDPTQLPDWPASSSWTQVSSSPNTWDFNYTNTDWTAIFSYKFTSSSNPNGVSVDGANFYDVNSASSLFNKCTAITSVRLADWGNGVGRIDFMFSGCSALTDVSLPAQDSRSTVRPYYHCEGMFYECATLVSAPMFDTSKMGGFHSMFGYCTSLTTVPSYNMSNAENTTAMFTHCTSLVTAPSLDTSNCQVMTQMFYGCTALSAVPLYNTQSAVNVSSMFSGCTNVTGGALALYNQMTTQTTPPTYHTECFNYCGSNTVTGAAELAQIPTSWGGTMA